jgi:hypothetical protein
MSRTAHYVASTHWDREWYEPLQGFRMRLVSLLDEVIQTLEADPNFKSFVMDAQSIPLLDYLEVRPEKRELLGRLLQDRRIIAGPWFVLPDEWLVSAESIVRNLEMGMAVARELGGEPSRAGGVFDQFGHISQLPQIFVQFGIPAAYVWRGTTERDHHGHFIWEAPDGTSLPTYRFGPGGYCTYAFRVRKPWDHTKYFELETAVDWLVEYTLFESKRSDVGPILLFDGADHLEIEPQTSTLIARANEKLSAHGIRIMHSDLDAYQAELLKDESKIRNKLVGELRETGREPSTQDEQWLIPGVLSSRIHLKQRNAQCEDELCLWAEPFSTFAATALGSDYPAGFLRVAWKWLLENHPHDSICGCSIDPVHQDMIFRFDQSYGIASRLTNNALKAIALAASPKDRPEGSIVLGIFNATAEAVDEFIDVDVPLPLKWVKKFQEFFGFEEKFAFRLRGPGGEEIPYQLVGQQRERARFRRPRYKFPDMDSRHVVSVTARLKVPAMGYTTLIVEPAEGPTRYSGRSLVSSHRSMENEHLRLSINPNGTIDLHDKSTRINFTQLLTFEQRADIGDGWYHGLAVNDQVYFSTAGSAEVALLADGFGKATFRIITTMNVPKDFHRRTMTRCETLWPLKIVSDVTLRADSDRVEVTTTIDNQVLDHRVRVLFPTGLKGETYLSDSAFDVVERPVALLPDNDQRKELDVETRPQISWTAFGDGSVGLAVVSRGLPESAVIDNPDRAIALTLLRSFRRAVFAGDNMGGQIQGKHMFRFDIVPFKRLAPVKRLFLLGQRVNTPTRQVSLTSADFVPTDPSGTLPREQSLLNVAGEVVVTSLRKAGDAVELRAFNPTDLKQELSINGGMLTQAEPVTLEGKADERVPVKSKTDLLTATLPPRRIVTLRLR